MSEGDWGEDSDLDLQAMDAGALYPFPLGVLPPPETPIGELLDSLDAELGSLETPEPQALLIASTLELAWEIYTRLSEKEQLQFRARLRGGAQ